MSSKALLTQGLRYRGIWSNTTAYAVGDVVTLNDTSYVAGLAHTGHSPPDTGFWDGGLFAAGGTGSGSGANLTYVVATADAPSDVRAAADFQMDGTDDDVQVQQAIDLIAALTAPVGGFVWSKPGGVVRIVGIEANFTSPVRMKTGVTVEGDSWWATSVVAKASMTAAFILDSTSVERTTLRNLQINGNKASFSCAGVSYANNGGTYLDAPDTMHTLEKLYIRNCALDGITIGTNTRAARITDVRVSLCSQWGFNLAGSDAFVTNCEARGCGTDDGTFTYGGFNCNGGNIHWLSCKSFFARGDGFQINAVRNTLSACEAQDNYANGFHLGSASNSCTMVGVYGNGNGMFSTGATNDAGLYIEGGQHTIVGIFDDRGFGEGNQNTLLTRWGTRQQYGVRFRDDFASNVTLIANCKNNAVDHVVGGRAASDAHIITINGPLTQNDEQTVQILATTSGTFTLAVTGYGTSGAITYSSTQSTLRTNIQNALTALLTGGATCSVSNGTISSTFKVAFTGTLAGTPVATMTANAAGLVGGAPTVTVAHSMIGNSALTREARFGFAPVVESIMAAQPDDSLIHNGGGIKFYDPGRSNKLSERVKTAGGVARTVVIEA